MKKEKTGFETWLEKNEPQHTPGPWKVITTNPSVIFISSESHGGICTIPHDKHAITEHFTNAHLIASAPDLLKALKAIQARIDGNFDSKDLLEYGELSTNKVSDIQRIIKSVL